MTVKHEPKKHFDVHKPRRHEPDPTSKPIIVGHHPMMPDPMIRDERQNAAKPISVISDGEVLPRPAEPPKQPDLSDISTPNETSPALTPSAPTEPHPGPEPPSHPDAAESPPGAVFPPTESAQEGVMSQAQPRMPEPQAAIHQPNLAAKEPLPSAPAEPPAGQELHIPAGHAVVHHRPRLWVWALMVLIVLAWIYAAVDVLTSTKLPFEFFKNTNP